LSPQKDINWNKRKVIRIIAPPRYILFLFCFLAPTYMKRIPKNNKMSIITVYMAKYFLIFEGFKIKEYHHNSNC
jgi:hypothetical protein